MIQSGDLQFVVIYRYYISLVCGSVIGLVKCFNNAIKYLRRFGFNTALPAVSAASGKY